MQNFKMDIPEIESELGEVVRMFGASDNPSFKIDFFWNLAHSEEIFVRINNQTFSYPKPIIHAQIKHEYRRLFVREAKKALYKALESHLGHSLPWGATTGIRPTKLVYEMLGRGETLPTIVKNLQKEFFISAPKADLVTQIVANQTGFLERNSRFVNLYIHIPLCPDKCKYCSFVSVPMHKQKGLIAPYVEKLVQEIQAAKAFIASNNQKIYSVYMGGGTPTALDDMDFKTILQAVGSLTKGTEFTVEAGRPETITREKCTIMQACGVTRVSVNPQSLNDDTLISIGRGHTVEDFYTAFNVAKAFGFSINTDCIAGLADESSEDFMHTMDRLVALKPDNITLHTLSVKRGSILKESRQGIAGDSNPCNSGLVNNSISNRVEKSLQLLSQNGYLPYYLYRQKQMLENLENIGFCLPNTQCVNNISVMEESLSVVACGAGAISKRIEHDKNLIQRFANPKDIKLYLERFDTILKNKQQFFA